MGYQVFISYRRSNGFYMATLLRDRLDARGISVFLDQEELTSGRFDTKIEEIIRESPNFVLVLSQGALDRCSLPDDWVAREVSVAVESGSNIIPVASEDFSWPDAWPDGTPECVRNLQNQNWVRGSQDYLDAMMDRLVSYLDGVDRRRGHGARPTNSRVPRDTIILGTSDLTVVDCVMRGWEADDVFGELGFRVERRPYKKWSDKILVDLENGDIDIAIYNRQSTLRYNEEHGSPIYIGRDVCSSMGGRNFYLLASRSGRWHDMTLDQFKESLDSSVTFGIPRPSDIMNNLLYVLDLSEQELLDLGVTIKNYRSNQGLDIFDWDEDALIAAGQDIRFLAEQSDEYFELLSFDKIPKEKQHVFLRNSINSFLVGPAGRNKLGDIDIRQVISRLMSNFYANISDVTASHEIRRALSRQLMRICDDEASADYIVRKILFETYRVLPEGTDL